MPGFSRCGGLIHKQLHGAVCEHKCCLPVLDTHEHVCTMTVKLPTGVVICRQGRVSGVGHSSAAGQSAPGEAAATAEDAVPELKHFGSTLPKTQQPDEEDAAFAPPPQPPPQAESPVGPAQQQQQQGRRQGAEPLAAQEIGPKSIERSPSSGRRLTPFPYDLASADGGLCSEQHDPKAVTLQPGEPGSRLAAADSPDGPAEGRPRVPEAGAMSSSMDVSAAGAEHPQYQLLGEAVTAADNALTSGRPRASSAADDPFSTGRHAHLTSPTVKFQAATAAAEHRADAGMGMAAAAPGSEDATSLPPETEEEAAEAAATAAAQGAAAVEPASPGPAPPPTLPFYRCLPAWSTAQLLHLLIQQAELS